MVLRLGWGRVTHILRPVVLHLVPQGVAFIPVEEPIFYGKYYLLTPKKERPGTDTVAEFLTELLTKDDPGCKVL